ncbi:acyl-coenzyme A thioesterase THEM4-like isoform X1 [Rhinatrema bivittatum]|uniref:acyl-coenzyme A thioesterase THEM4-like isoform X1 n=1 Tax=Rhinatrema bivittatum TaxID=194408 RepID=UPI00112E8E37|nr:acyl-coenzyme A thioesterase THEM4-like isoform X1 [Rhinatrema bivittatum]XP_029435254.1 acyl-coenzyme A thioesterase THEM4-like isoform X1 [Rhinatrema bivittatum]XP_029435255.1 acyl-coenzyme A thioesterase THEM4-like isoform X1 [Rhinatrema bivittatum]
MFRYSMRLFRGLSPAWLQKQPVLSLLLYRTGLQAACLPSRDLRVTGPHAQNHKDYALPNASWSQDMRNLYSKYMILSQSGDWMRLPSYNSTITHLGEICPGSAKPKVTTRLFTRNMDVEGLGFEYFMFYNQAEKRTVCIFQAGPYLEGPFGMPEIRCSLWVYVEESRERTRRPQCESLYCHQLCHLSCLHYIPIALGSTVIVESKLDKIEGRKVYLTTEIRSVDGEKFHTDATALFIKLDLPN